MFTFSYGRSCFVIPSRKCFPQVKLDFLIGWDFPWTLQMDLFLINFVFMCLLPTADVPTTMMPFVFRPFYHQTPPTWNVLLLPFSLFISSNSLPPKRNCMYVFCSWQVFIYFILFWVFFVCLFVFLLHCEAYGILVPWPGIEPVPPAVEALSLNHWTTREIPLSMYFRHRGSELIFGHWVCCRNTIKQSFRVLNNEDTTSHWCVGAWGNWPFPACKMAYYFKESPRRKS